MDTNQIPAGQILHPTDRKPFLLIFFKRERYHVLKFSFDPGKSQWVRTGAKLYYASEGAARRAAKKWANKDGLRYDPTVEVQGD